MGKINKDARDSTKIQTLPDDLKSIAEEMIAEKFGLATQGEVMEQKTLNYDDGCDSDLGLKEDGGMRSTADSIRMREYASPSRPIYDDYQLGKDRRAIELEQYFLHSGRFSNILKDINIQRYRDMTTVQIYSRYNEAITFNIPRGEYECMGNRELACLVEEHIRRMEKRYERESAEHWSPKGFFF